MVMSLIRQVWLMHFGVLQFALAGWCWPRRKLPRWRLVGGDESGEEPLRRIQT
jgi:hypothetical protein